MRRRPSTPSVTLFPFLAVLVCTMGALIFLLLVITQKIQKQTQLPLVNIEEPVADEITLEPSPSEFLPTGGFIPLLEPDVSDIPIVVPIEFDEDEPILPLLAGNTIEDHEWLQKEWEARQRAYRLAHEKKLNERNEQQRKLDEKLKTQTSELATEIERKRKELEKLSALLSKSQQELALLDEKQRAAKANVSLTNKQVSEALMAHRREQEKRFEFQKQAAELTRQIARLEEQNANAIPEAEIVAYDSITGTSRKPILIECKESEIVFASEGVVLSATDLSGFPPEYNPLKAGAEALLKYWNQNGQPHERPYVLLVVRPEGTTGFYVARGLLSELDHQFGYELVETDRAIRWPTADPAAMKVCQEAVFSVLSERDRVAAKLGRITSLIGGPLSYSNAQGEFHLPDAESNDRSGVGNYIGDEKWISPKQRERQNLSNLNTARSKRATQRGEAPRSIARPIPSEGATPLFDNMTERQQAIANKQSLGQASQPTSKLFSNQQEQQQNSREMNQPRQLPSRINGSNAKPLQPGQPQQSGPSLPVNPFEPPQAASQPQKESRYGVQIATPKRTGVIGIERETEIHLWPDKFQIDDATAMKIPTGIDSTEVKRAMTSAFAKSTAEWDSPPKSYFWKPVVKIVIHPGGLLHYAAVKELADSWDVPARVEYELN